jgi:polyisoprenoid-binding protein YceI
MIPASRLLPALAWLALSAAAPGRLLAQAAAYDIDPAASRVRIHLGRAGLIKFLGHEHHIEAPVSNGRIEVVDDDPRRSRVTLRFEAARLAIVPGSEPAGDVPKVEERMRGPEVLDAARYPEIAFVSTSVRSGTQDGAAVRIVVAGTLALRGRAIPVEVPLEVERGRDAIEARGAVDLELRDLGIEPPAVAGVVKVANRFRLEFEIRARAAGRP